MSTKIFTYVERKTLNLNFVLLNSLLIGIIVSTNYHLLDNPIIRYAKRIIRWPDEPKNLTVFHIYCRLSLSKAKLIKIHLSLRHFLFMLLSDDTKYRPPFCIRELHFALSLFFANKKFPEPKQNKILSNTKFFKHK